MTIRTSGILLHPTSLPSPYGIGDLGPSARKFTDFLARAGQHYWQVLPLTPTRNEYGYSPYHSVSSFAGNLLLISPEQLVSDGFIRPADLPSPSRLGTARVAFAAASRLKSTLLDIACRRFAAMDIACRMEYERFCEREHWLDDCALYVCLRKRHGPDWRKWPRPLRNRHKRSLSVVRRELSGEIEKYRIKQFLFFNQWQSLKSYCNRQGIRIIGDLPIYLPLDCAEVWTRPDLFDLDRDGNPLAVSGVPPDYFSRTGQLWGHPLYRWDRMEKNGFQWWIDRLAHQLRLFDLIRIDHFRGLVAFWKVPAGQATAVDGQWVKAPAMALFKALIRQLGQLPVIAEDLGTITADVREIIDRFGFPGMRVLQFAFGDDFPRSAFLPHHHVRNCIVYTGTHDNNTLRGWFTNEATSLVKKNLQAYLGRKITAETVHLEMIRLALMSTADTAVVPMQDVLGLGASARMNHPGGKRHNWCWRMNADALTVRTADRLLRMAQTYGRTS